MTKTFAIAAVAAVAIALTTGSSFASPCHNNSYQTYYAPAPIQTIVYTYPTPVYGHVIGY